MFCFLLFHKNLTCIKIINIQKLLHTWMLFVETKKQKIFFCFYVKQQLFNLNCWNDFKNAFLVKKGQILNNYTQTHTHTLEYVIHIIVKSTHFVDYCFFQTINEFKWIQMIFVFKLTLFFVLKVLNLEFQRFFSINYI